MTFKIVKYDDKFELDWDNFLKECSNSSWLHSRKFLSYHGDRFCDKSLIVFDDEKIVAVLPAAISQVNEDTIVSHPGSTFGGILSKSLIGLDILHVLEMICDYFRLEGFKYLEYKPTPFFYHSKVFSDDIYALSILGAQRHRVDITSLIDLKKPNLLSKRRVRSLKNAKSSKLTILQPKACNELWELVSQNLQKKYGVLPVHSLEEISKLIQLFPSDIKIIVANYEDKLIAGLVLFLNRDVVHAQYIASSDDGNKFNGLDLLFDHTINTYRQLGFKWFDFGISTQDDGKTLNKGLYQFKSEFGSGSATHEFYRLKIK